ncbi:phage terminase large subunit family protein [Massilia yuzhufengensis]|uniref:Phage terminase, large subunit GpA n=1 Tax=Massilia yuzhufengensis TaxID=1164594 RepID=A0A1I1VRS3_9BURK|nr:phage terminase large subunit family protein [Massilia yuzhufengensis]SFD83723.1 Phage terminase, large subunit GpA [Massilia yuzhufengensis]
MIGFASAAGVVQPALARGLAPDPNMTVDAWADQYMIIPKESGANESGKYRTSRTPHARAVMEALSDSHWCKTVALMGASQMLKTQVGLNWFCASVHQSPANFLWILPTGKLAKRTSARVSKTIAAVPEVRERVAAPRSRDSVNTLDTKEYIGGSLHIVTAGAAANLSEIPARRVLFDEVDRAENNVNGEGDPVALAKARQTTFERNRKSYFPSSPTITGQSIIESLYQQGTQQEALAECVHCAHAQPLVFERLQQDDEGRAIYPCVDCGAAMYETDKNRMFAGGLWSHGVPGDGETVSFTINAMFAPYGWLPWIAMLREYRAARAKLDEGSEELMITFYNTRLARCWERKKEQTKAGELQARAEEYKCGTVPKGGLILTATVDTQPDRFELKVVAWGEGMEAWIVDYQVIAGSPSDQATQDKLEEALQIRYRHHGGRMLAIAAAFIDSGGANTHDVYNFTRTRQYRNVYAIKGASTLNKPILSAKPSLVDVSWQGKVMPHGAKLWLIGTDTAKDYLAARYHLASGPGAIHFPSDLPKEYYEQLTAEYCVNVYKRGRKVRIWEKKKSDRNEAGDLMVYAVACAQYLGLHKKTAAQWKTVRAVVDPDTPDMFDQPAVAEDGETVLAAAAVPSPTPQNNTGSDPWQPTAKPSPTSSVPRRPAGRQW